MPIQELSDGLWTAQGRVRWMGQRVPTRTLVLRLPDGALWVHSPIALGAELAGAVDRLGPVAHLVAPSTYHHLWLAEWARRYPEARVHGAPGLAEKRRDIEFHEVLGDRAPLAWSGVLDQMVLGGLPLFNEVVFFHRPSRTLIVTDLVFNVYDAEGALAPLVLRLNDMWRRFGPSRVLRLMLRRNRERVRADLERIQQWSYDRVAMAHGRVLESGGRAAMERAFAFLG